MPQPPDTPTGTVSDTSVLPLMKPTLSLSMPPLTESVGQLPRPLPAASWMLAALAVAVPVTPAAAVTERELQAELAWTIDFKSAAEAAELARAVQRRARLRTTLISLFRDRPVEDGWTHPAQDVVERYLAEYGKGAISDVVWMFAQMEQHYRAELMKCLGRLDSQVADVANDSALLTLVSGSLADNSLELRDATVCALERWGSPVALGLLRSHVDPEPWLADYVRQVVRESESSRIWPTP